MDAFETIVATLVRRKGYWATVNLKIDLKELLTDSERAEAELSSCRRWEFDIVAFKATTNEVLVIECKSFLNSKGVRMADGKLQRETTYKLFNSKKKRDGVLKALGSHLLQNDMCRESPKIRLVLAAGKIQDRSRRSVGEYAKSGGWELWNEQYIHKMLSEAATDRYENDVAILTAKLLRQKRRRDCDKYQTTF